MSPSRLYPSIVLALVLLLPLAACDGDGGDGAGDVAPDAAAADTVPADIAPADVVAPSDAAGDAAAGDAAGACEFEGLLIPRGESRCPCEGCDEVISCSAEGEVAAGECFIGNTCVQETPTQATCVCANYEDGVCPPGGGCPDDPDCDAAPCVVGEETLPVGARACDCATPPCEAMVTCQVDGTLLAAPCDQGLHCIEINPTTAGCLCDEAQDAFCPGACPADPDC